jgi:hypothetical protein
VLEVVWECTQRNASGATTTAILYGFNGPGVGSQFTLTAPNTTFAKRTDTLTLPVGMNIAQLLVDINVFIGGSGTPTGGVVLKVYDVRVKARS